MTIKDLKPRPPIGAAISIGRKGPRGFPVDKDRFWIVAPRDVDGVRPPLWEFSKFNNAEPERRRVIHGNLMHRAPEDCFTQTLTMMAFPKEHPAPRAHPNMMPVCKGDGEHAERWDGSEFKTIICPHKHCQFRQTTPPACKPFSQLIFRLRWLNVDLPCPLVKFNSGSWETAANLAGLFVFLDEAASGIGLNNPVLTGFPFTLTLIERTKASKRARFPVVTVTPDMDPVEFFLKQSGMLKELGALPPPIQKLQDESAVYEDIQQLSVPAK